jgi:hypothetical protein
MHSVRCAILSALAICLAAPGAAIQAQPLVLRAEPNQTQYLPGDVLRVKFLTDAATPQIQLDVYAGIIRTDQRSTLFFTSLLPTAWQGADLRGNPAAFPRLLTSTSIAAGTNRLPNSLSVTVPPTIALGTYSVLFAAARTASLSDGNVDADDLVAFTKVPLNVVAPPAPPTASTYAPFRPLMAQAVSAGSLHVTGSSVVRTAALTEARRQLDAMLRYRPDVIATLRAAGALVGVFAETENVCSLLYFSDLDGQSICTTAPGGLGGVPARPATGCSERSLLKLSSDQFGRGTATGENTCVHEIAHLIMNLGLGDGERALIAVEFERAKAAGIWGTDFIVAANTDDEFFAELSQAYFCANPDTPAFNHQSGVNCPYSLQSFDPQSFALMESIYGESSDLR